MVSRASGATTTVASCNAPSVAPELHGLLRALRPMRHRRNESALVPAVPAARKRFPRSRFGAYRFAHLAPREIAIAAQLVCAAGNARRHVLAYGRIQMRTPRCGALGGQRRVGASLPATLDRGPVAAIERAKRHRNVRNGSPRAMSALDASDGSCDLARVVLPDEAAGHA
jgi:hypothetical protein